MKKLKIFGLLALAVVLAFGLFGCGGSDDDDDSSDNAFNEKTYYSTYTRGGKTYDVETVVSKTKRSTIPEGTYYYISYIVDPYEVLSQGTVQIKNGYALFTDDKGNTFNGMENGGDITVTIPGPDGTVIIVKPDGGSDKPSTGGPGPQQPSNTTVGILAVGSGTPTDLITMTFTVDGEAYTPPNLIGKFTFTNGGGTDASVTNVRAGSLPNQYLADVAFTIEGTVTVTVTGVTNHTFGTTTANSNVVQLELAPVVTLNKISTISIEPSATMIKEIWNAADTIVVAAVTATEDVTLGTAYWAKASNAAVGDALPAGTTFASHTLIDTDKVYLIIPITGLTDDTADEWDPDGVTASAEWGDVVVMPATGTPTYLYIEYELGKAQLKKVTSLEVSGLPTLASLVAGIGSNWPTPSLTVTGNGGNVTSSGVFTVTGVGFVPAAKTVADVVAGDKVSDPVAVGSYKYFLTVALVDATAVDWGASLGVSAEDTGSTALADATVTATPASGAIVNILIPYVIAQEITGGNFAVTAPADAGTPEGNADITPTGTGFTVDTVTWAPQADLDANGKFQAGKQYTVTITLAPAQDYAFKAAADYAANAWTVNTSNNVTTKANAGDNFTITYQFAKIPDAWSCTCGGGANCAGSPACTTGNCACEEAAGANQCAGELDCGHFGCPGYTPAHHTDSGVDCSDHNFACEGTAAGFVGYDKHIACAGAAGGGGCTVFQCASGYTTASGTHQIVTAGDGTTACVHTSMCSFGGIHTATTSPTCASAATHLFVCATPGVGAGDHVACDAGTGGCGADKCDATYDDDGHAECETDGALVGCGKCVNEGSAGDHDKCPYCTTRACDTSVIHSSDGGTTACQ